MKRRYVAFGLAGLVVATVALPLHARAPKRPLKVMTYNIDSAAKIPFGPREIDLIAKEIEREQADFVGMTEVDIETDWHDGRDMVGELAVALARNKYVMHHYYTPTLTYKGGNMALVIWSRFIIDEGNFVVTVPEGSAGWKVAHITARPDGKKPVHIFMSHYYIGSPCCHKHQQQTDRVIEFVAKHEGPRVLIGDFNFTPEEPYYQQYIEADLHDACVVTVGHPLATVGGGAGIVAPERIKQIDFIFGSREVGFLARASAH